MGGDADLGTIDVHFYEKPDFSGHESSSDQEPRRCGLELNGGCDPGNRQSIRRCADRCAPSLLGRGYSERTVDL